MSTKKSSLLFGFILICILQINFTFAAEPKFHAVYDCIFDTEVDNIFIEKAVISKDGKVVICYGKNSSNKPVLYRMKSDGTEFIQFTLPTYVMETVGHISDVTIGGDGEIAYFYSGFRIYKVVSNSITKIFDSETDSDEIGQFYNLQATYNGNVVFFRLSETVDGGSVWQIDQSGLNLIKIIDPADVVHNWGKGAGLTTFAISDNAGTIAFILRGYRDDEDIFQYNHALFLKTDPLVFKQLTFDAEALNDDWLDISGDGKRVVYHKTYPADSLKHYYVYDSDGSYQTVLAQIDAPGYKDMNYSGSTLLLNDSRSQGRLVATDGSSEFDIIPLGLGLWNTDISLSYVNKTCVVSNNPGTKGVYVGHLYNQDAHFDNPTINSVTFDPQTFPKNNPDTWIKLKAEISNPDGLDEIDYAEVNILLDGENKKMGYSSSQVYFPQRPYDNGNDPDEVAGDGIFTTYCKATNVFSDSETFKDQTYVRVVVRNNSKSFAIHDVLLKIEYATAVEDGDILSSPVDYSLSQNYPNPFNPSTKINYTIPGQSNVTLKIFDVLGREVSTLINEQHKVGYHEITWDASNLLSGVYFISIVATGVDANTSFRKVNKALLIK